MQIGIYWKHLNEEGKKLVMDSLGVSERNGFNNELYQLPIASFESDGWTSFKKQFKPIYNTDKDKDRDAWEGCLFDKIDSLECITKHIWSLIKDDDDRNEVVVPGIENMAIGYFVCENEWVDDSITFVVWEYNPIDDIDELQERIDELEASKDALVMEREFASNERREVIKEEIAYINDQLNDIYERKESAEEYRDSLVDHR